MGHPSVVPGVGTTSSNNHYKFTGKERDSESGLDYFGARYYANVTGRFMSPDWAAKPTSVPYAEFGDPQSLNLYSYVRNSPIVRVDADGHNPILDNEGFRGLDEWEERSLYGQQPEFEGDGEQDGSGGQPRPGNISPPSCNGLANCVSQTTDIYQTEDFDPRDPNSDITVTKTQIVWRTVDNGDGTVTSTGGTVDTILRESDKGSGGYFQSVSMQTITIDKVTGQTTYGPRQTDIHSVSMEEAGRAFTGGVGGHAAIGQVSLELHVARIDYSAQFMHLKLMDQLRRQEQEGMREGIFGTIRTLFRVFLHTSSE